jgi:hypothetical protein
VLKGGEEKRGRRLGTSRSRSGFSGKRFLPATRAKYPAGFARPMEALRELALLLKDKAFAARYLAGETGAVKRFPRLHVVAFGE